MDLEDEKRHRRQDRHRTLERIRRDKTQSLLSEIQVTTFVVSSLHICASVQFFPWNPARKLALSCRHLFLEFGNASKTTNNNQAELAKWTGQKQPSDFTLNKSLSHIVAQVRRIREMQMQQVRMTFFLAKLVSLLQCARNFEQDSEKKTFPLCTLGNDQQCNCWL